MIGNKKPVLIVMALSAVLLAGAIIISLPGSNPTDEKGTLTGYIVDAADNSPLKGVTVTGTDQKGTRYTEHEYTDTTGADGFFSLELPPNDYKLDFEAEGYQSYVSSAAYTVKNEDTLEIRESFRLVALNSPQADGGQEDHPGESVPVVSPENAEGGQELPVSDDRVSYTVLCTDSTNGETIQKETFTGKIGATVSVDAQELDGYTSRYDELTKVLSGNETDNVFNFIYDPYEYEEPAVAPVSPADDLGAPSLFYNGHSYCAVRTGSITSFWQAQSFCSEHGGYLAIIDDAGENEALYDFVFYDCGYDSAYFGLTDDGSEGGWYWIDGTDAEYRYRNWLPGQPDNLRGTENYALFYYKDTPYKWNDGDFGMDAAGTVTFLIEWDSQ